LFSSRTMIWDWLSFKTSINCCFVNTGITDLTWMIDFHLRKLHYQKNYREALPSHRSRTHGACNNTEVCGLQVAIHTNLKTSNASFVLDKSSFLIVYRIEASHSVLHLRLIIVWCIIHSSSSNHSLLYHTLIDVFDVKCA
jgi:hypothetical protein